MLKSFENMLKCHISNIMSTAYQDNQGHKKLEWDKDQQQQTNVKDRAQSSRSKNIFLLQLHLQTTLD